MAVARKTSIEKWILVRTCKWLDVLTPLFHLETKKIYRQGLCSQTMQVLMSICCWFVEDHQEFCKVLECMCLAIVLPIRSSVFPGVRVAAMVCLRSLFFELRVTGGKLVAQTQKCVVKYQLLMQLSSLFLPKWHSCLLFSDKLMW